MDVWREDELTQQVVEHLGSNAEFYDIPGIVRDIRDRFGQATELSWVDEDTLQAIVSSNEL